MKEDESMAPIEPNLDQCFDGQPVFQTPIDSSDFDGLETQVPWNPAPMTETTMDNTSMMTMPNPPSQRAFTQATAPTMSGISNFDPMVTTTWPPNAMSFPRRTAATSGPRSEGTGQAENPRGQTASWNNSSKRGQQHPTSDMSNTVEPIQLDTRFGTLPEKAPSNIGDRSAGARKTDENNQTTLNTGLTAAEQSQWLRDNAVVIPDDDIDDEPDNRDLKSREGHKDPSDNGHSGASSPAQTRPATKEHRARNRMAATKCRARAKAATAELEATERETESQHQELSAEASSLHTEVLALKNELLMHGNCNNQAIQQYLSNAAKNIVDSGVSKRPPTNLSSM
ncbi:Transcription factor atf21 [Cytospora mali]|uniref:Transcription factor atf21 n=1 Tax=Cytospora mali TaxID=578113 RepID=A0A194V4R1_CYTMA|nr:Transcription factor atf21 [Valsa mali var. pyri (nom. inval.)]